MRRSILISLSVFILAFGVGCSSLGTPGPGVVINVTNSFTSIQAGAAAITLNATVENDKDKKGVKWQLSLANTECSPACGTLVAAKSPSFSAVYTPPKDAPINQAATITAVSVKDDHQIFVFNFTITPVISVTITNKFSTVTAGGPAVGLNATVAYDSSNAGVNWTLTAGGGNCSPDCGTLTVPASPTLTATYTPPAVFPSGANGSPTITATSAADSTRSDSFSFTVASALSLFKGSYAFLLRGYDLTGSPMAMAGSVVADGNGNITGGELDINNGGGVTSVPAPGAGSYNINTSFNLITRGTLTLTNFTFPGSSNTITLRFVLSADGKRGRVVELDGGGFINSGTIQLQDSGALTAADPSGAYVFGLDSDAPVGGRTVAAGQVVLGSSGVTSGIIDESKAGDATPRYSGVAIEPGPFTKPDGSGRGTVTFSVDGTSTEYAYYVVDSQRMNLIEIDNGITFGTVRAGVAQAQKQLTAESVNGTSVLQLTGMDSPSGTTTIGPAVLIGVMQISSGSAFGLTFDSNDVGTILTGHPAAGTVASFDVATGRGVLADPGGFQSGFMDSVIFYLSDTGAGFVIDADPSTPDGTPPDAAITNNAYSGTLTLQKAGPFSSQSLTGNSLGGFGGSAAPDTPNVAAAFRFDGDAGTYTATGDLATTNRPGDQGGNIPDISFAGSFSLIDSLTGHGVIQFQAPLFGDFSGNQQYTSSFYMIGPNEFVAIGVQSGIFSGVAHFEPQQTANTD